MTTVRGSRLVASGAIAALALTTGATGALAGTRTAAGARSTGGTAAPAATPGTAGIGDRLFPELGNGGYDAKAYDLTLRYPAKDPQQTVTGDVTMRARATQDLSRFDLDFSGLSVGSVQVNGRAASFARVREELVVTPARVIRKGSPFTVTVRRFSAR
ncbi:MAG TPA: hypothetical protein VE781_16250, partial [Kineosporiaceae bacterium]|nr:hypothetical protein [Kineosporiaceae bacterium]